MFEHKRLYLEALGALLNIVLVERVTLWVGEPTDYTFAYPNFERLCMLSVNIRTSAWRNPGCVTRLMLRRCIRKKDLARGL